MSHTVTYNSNLCVIEIKFQGNVTLNEIKELFSESAQVVKERNCFLFLSDFREAIINLSTLEIYELPNILSNTLASSGIPAHKLKRALVAAKDLEDYRFFETVTANRGQSTKVFYDIAEAKAWLSNK